jgi:hypothetical protein
VRPREELLLRHDVEACLGLRAAELGHVDAQEALEAELDLKNTLSADERLPGDAGEVVEPVALDLGVLAPRPSPLDS